MKFITLFVLIVSVSGCTQLKLSNEVWELTQGIKYTDDVMGKDYWQTPQETLNRRRGDCDDIAILIYYHLIEKGEKPKLVFGCKAKGCHLWVRSGNWDYDRSGAHKAPMKGYRESGLNLRTWLSMLKRKAKESAM